MGSHHTVYHSTAALPTSDQPRADGMPTLIWFSGTWCEFCEQMEPWAHATAAEFADRVVFVEKSVDHDRAAAARYGVRGTPTFVLIDASGRRLSQFSFQSSVSAFKSAIQQALKQAGGV
jgi:thiol-disulfide isomerase/thioredoxin